MQTKTISPLNKFYMKCLGRDFRTGEITKGMTLQLSKPNSTASRTSKPERSFVGLVSMAGNAYIEGIQPPLEARHFDSSWDWARKDALLMYYDIIHGKLTTADRPEITVQCIAIINRSDPDLVRYMQYHIGRRHPLKKETYKLAKEFGQEFINNTQAVLGRPLCSFNALKLCCFTIPFRTISLRKVTSSSP
jgi:fatty acid synthase subunit alpha